LISSFIVSVWMRGAMPEQRLKFVRFVEFKEYLRPSGRKERIQYNLYQCVCGNQKVIRKSSVTDKNNNSSFSCGCLRMENLQKILEKGLNRHKGKGKTGQKAHNKGKVRITLNGKIRYVDDRELAEIYYGVA